MLMQPSFFKMGQSRPLFVYFRHFLYTISIIQIEKSVDGVLGTRTRGRRMVGADETTELWRPPKCQAFLLKGEVIICPAMVNSIVSLLSAHKIVRLFCHHLLWLDFDV